MKWIIGAITLAGVLSGIYSLFKMNQLSGISQIALAAVCPLITIAFLSLKGNPNIAIKAKNILYVAVVMSLGALVFGIDYYSIVAGLITLSLVVELLLVQFTIKKPTE